MSKEYFRATEDKQIVQVGVDVVLADAVLALVESGIDEDAHFWSSDWHEFDDHDDDLERALNNSEMLAMMFEHIKLPLIEKLKQILKERRKETQRHSLK